MSQLRITSGQEWTFEMVEEVYQHCERIARDKYGLDFYTNQLEVITAEQMLDAYSAVGLPISYAHWSFGEQFVREQEMYKRGYMGLAYEIVINSDPCIAYLMEENTMLMQSLVIAHACFGHNHFFKNNYLFRQWTDAEAIIDYLMFAKKYIRECEERHGADEVERLIDACHALRHYGVDKYKRPPALSVKEEEERRKEREAYRQSQLNLLWSTVPKKKKGKKKDEDEDQFPKEPQENLLYFIEKHAPRLEEWQREVIRIVRRTSQYFYPQMQTQVMNEGCATFFHYKIINDLHDEGILDDGAMMEFMISHTNVVTQRGFDEQHYNGINPYALGWKMYKEIERVAMDPTDEDREWFAGQDWVGSGEYLPTIHHAIKNFKDESFIAQFLTPKTMREMRMFAIHDDEKDPRYLVSGIHNQQGYKTVRKTLAQTYNIGYKIPDIQVTDVDRWGDRTMTLHHTMVNKRPLEPDSATETLKYISYLWGYPVRLESVDNSGTTRAIFDMKESETLLDVFLDDED